MHRGRKRWIWVLAAVAACSLSGCARGLGLPDVSVLKTRYPVVHPLTPERARELHRDNAITFEKRRPASWVPLTEVSKAAAGAIIVSEDWAFYHHKGYDPNQIKEALDKDLEEGRYARGASTITQQVARNLFLDSDKKMGRKLKELFLAVRLEQVLSKRKILEIYLNIVEWGDGIYGIGAASKFYFSKSPAALTAKEGAFLAMLLPSPRRYSVSFRKKALTPYARKTVSDILNKMVQARYLTEEERVALEAVPLSFVAVPAPSKVP